MINALDHVTIAVADLDAATRAYETLLGRAGEPLGETGGARRTRFQLLNTAVELIAPGGSGPAGEAVRQRIESAGEGLWRLAFATDDLGATRRTLERRGMACAPDDGAAEPTVIIDAGATHGVSIAVLERSRGIARQPSPVIGAPEAALVRLDHVVVGTPNPDRAMALYGARLGLDLRLDRSNPAWGSRLLFFRCGDLVIEIGASLKTPLSEQPDRLGGLAWRPADAAAVHARLAGAGLNISERRKGRKPGSEVFTVRDQTCGVPTIVISGEDADANV
jgi:catechol 2,3-dioxygenase-like lactoylglutathione lyase family enzyme